MVSPTTSVVVHAEASDTKLTGKQLTTIFEGRDVTFLQGRYVAKDAKGSETYDQVELVVAPKKACCRWGCVAKVTGALIGAGLLVGIGYLARYLEEGNRV